jgi:putative aldouronate transport system permease protein
MATITAQSPARATVRWQKLRSYMYRTWPLYLMLLPAMVQLAIFSYYPMYGIIIAFQNYNPGLGFTGSPWVGWDNFRYLFSTPTFKSILWNSFFIAVAKILAVQVSAVTVALMINEAKNLLFKRTIQTILYLPHFLSWIVLGGILLDVLSAQGLVGKLQRAMGIQPILFLGSNTWFRPTLIVTEVWKSAGWATIIYLAALMGIDPQLHEAAAIDGASRWQRVLHVTWPGIQATVILIACLNLGNVLQAGFDQILTLYNPIVYRTADILDTYVYRAGLISARYSLGAATGLFKSVMGFLLIVTAYKLADKFAGYRIM